MKLKLHILSVASTATLRQIAEDFELSVADKRRRQALIEAVSLERRCQPKELLSYLREPDVKRVCEAAGVDGKGRRNELIDRLLEVASRTLAPVPKYSRPSVNYPKALDHTPMRRTMSDEQPAQAHLQLAPTEADTTNVEMYEFQPIKGYPMLNWRGKRPFASTQYYPAQIKEIHGEEVNGWRNKIYWGDNLQVMSHLLKQYRGNVDLIYIDPPFDSKADYKKHIRIKGVSASNDATNFEEKQYSDIWANDEYLQFIYERVVLLRELLTEEGSIFLHCDWHKSHYIRLILDEVFGCNSFVNEIIWQRTSAQSNASRFGNVHDTIFWYCKAGRYVWNPQFEPLSEFHVSSNYSYKDEKGVFKLADLTGKGQGPDRTFGAQGKLSPGIGRHWPSQDFLDELLAADQIYWTSSGKPYRKLYLEEADGRLLQSIWTDVKAFRGAAAESVGYPTQKPEALLERIVTAASNPCSLVLDCFMGSGTAQAVSMKLGRRFIGADINLGAIQTTTKRLIKVAEELRQKPLDPNTEYYTGFEVFNVNRYDIFRNPVQAKELLLEALEVQKLEFNTVFDGEKDGRMVKIMPVNRIATRADLNELIAGFDYRAWERRQAESPSRAVEKITLVCMGHEPDLKAQLELATKPFKIDVVVVDVLRDKADLEFKRDSEAKVVVKGGELTIERFFPMNLLQKLSLHKEAVDDWRELVESVLIDWNYDGAVLQPAVVDIPGKDDLVKGAYKVPDDAGTIRVKITDLLSESWEGTVSHG